MNAIELLKQDHKKVKDLFEQVRQLDERSEGTETAELQELYGKIREELEMHTHLEETIFYPAFSHHPQFKELLEESYEDHQEVKDLLTEIDDLGDDEDEDILDLLDELMDGVEGHVEMEEEEFFPLAREIMSETQLEELGARMSQAKGEVSRAA